mgnify:CR=1 FL=1
MAANGLRKLKYDPVAFAKLVGFEPFDYQAELLRDASKRIVACWGRQTGKSTTTALKALHFAFANPNKTILIVSPSERQSQLMFAKIRRFLHAEVQLANGRRIRPLEASIVRETQGMIELTNGSVIIPLPCSPDKIRGFTADLVIIDEAAFMPEEVITSVVMPMLAATDGTLIMLSTPWSKDHIFYRAFSGELEGWSVHHVPSSKCPLIKPGFLEAQRRVMTEAEFRREYLAEFVEEEACYFPMGLILRCVDPELKAAFTLEYAEVKPHGEYYAGLDLGKLRDFSVLAIVERSGERLLLRLLRVFEFNTPYSAVVAEVLRAYEKFGFIRLAMDRSGVGEGIYERLARELGEGVVEGFKFTAERKAELLAKLKMLMEKGRLKIPHDRLLINQLNGIRYEISRSGRLLFRHPPRGHDDAVMALALACWAAERPIGWAAKAWRARKRAKEHQEGDVKPGMCSRPIRG